MTRAMTFGVSGARVHFAAIDGQPCELFEPLHNLVPLAPGARVELMFDLPSTNPEDVVFSLKGGEWSPLAGESDRTALIFAAKGEPVTARPPIEALPENKALPKEIALERAKRVDVPLGGGGGSPFTIAGTSNIAWPAKPLFTVARGTPVTLAFSNKTQTAQTMHLGGHVGRLLHALDDGWEPYWRDVVSPAPGKTALLAFIPDAPGKWPLASASPEHRAFGLRAWFQVI